MRTYAGCITDRARTYMHDRSTRGLHVVEVQVAYLLYLVDTCSVQVQVDCRGSSTGWLQVSGTGWYSFTVVYLTVIV
jgi:hypothetical protein